MINLGHKIKETWVKLPEEYFTPLTFGELPIGQKFIVLPEPGDNQGQGGFRQANYLFIKYIPLSGELLVYCFAMIGGLCGFLWFNAHPAEIFMGDVGSLSFGGIIGTIAVMIKQELLFLIIAGVFVAETLSVIIQVLHYKRTKKRFFKMAPLHHHFELMGWKETKIISRFWIIGGILSVIALGSLKLR